MKYENGTKPAHLERMQEYVERVDYHARIRVRFGGQPGVVSRFVPQLEHNPRPWADGEWRAVARFDHQPHLEHGHDVYEEGLHMDFHFVDGRAYQLTLGRTWVSRDLGDVLHACKEFLREQYSELVADHLDCELPSGP